MRNHRDWTTHNGNYFDDDRGISTLNSKNFSGRDFVELVGPPPGSKFNTESTNRITPNTSIGKLTPMYQNPRVQVYKNSPSGRIINILNENNCNYMMKTNPEKNERLWSANSSLNL